MRLTLPALCASLLFAQVAAADIPPPRPAPRPAPPAPPPPPPGGCAGDPAPELSCALTGTNLECRTTDPCAGMLDASSLGTSRVEVGGKPAGKLSVVGGGRAVGLTLAEPPAAEVRVIIDAGVRNRAGDTPYTKGKGSKPLAGVAGAKREGSAFVLVLPAPEPPKASEVAEVVEGVACGDRGKLRAPRKLTRKGNSFELDVGGWGGGCPTGPVWTVVVEPKTKPVRARLCHKPENDRCEMLIRAPVRVDLGPSLAAAGTAAVKFLDK